MSKHDSDFVNMFSLIIGGLIVVALLELALARHIAAGTEVPQVYGDPLYTKSVDERLGPAAKEAVAGQDNSALAVQPSAGAELASAAAAASPTNGKEVFSQVCSACHATGLVGSPKAGDKAAWGPRIAKGKATLYEHAIKGFQGSAGVMPAKGGQPGLSDDLIKQGVDYMVSLAN